MQTSVFKAQLDLAGRLERPVVIHCVGSYHDLLSILKAQREANRPLPPKVMLHPFSLYSPYPLPLAPCPESFETNEPLTLPTTSYGCLYE